MARRVFYILWLALSLVQAFMTNLAPDEAYYWRYSQDLAWGYFDHPPFIAVMIKCGYALFKNEVGVRLLSIVATTFTIYFIERLSRPKDFLLFYMSVSSLAILHIAGIMAVPDVPLLLFSAGFFLLYKDYTEREKPYHIFLLAATVALLLLSKYHGILVIGFTVLSNLKLLKKPSFWAIVALSIAMFMPHVLWQDTHGYPSIAYHLFERNPLEYDISFTLNYLGAIPLVFAPLTGIVLLYFSLKKNDSKTPVQRAMRLSLWGTLLFFLAMSFRGRIEGNWVLFLCIPAICLGYQKLEQQDWSTKFIRISFYVTLFLVLAARTILIDDLWNIKTEFTGWRRWALEVQKEAGEEPVAFINSYQKAAEYEFYTGNKSFSLNNFMGRKDQYNIWNTENELQGKTVTVVSNYYIADTVKSLGTSRDTCQFVHIPNFRSSSNLRLAADTNEVVTHPGDSIRVSFIVSVANGSQVDAEANPYYPMRISYHYFSKHGVQNTTTSFVLTNDLIRGRERVTLSIPAPEMKGSYLLGLSVSTGWLPPSINGGKIRVKVL